MAARYPQVRKLHTTDQRQRGYLGEGPGLLCEKQVEGSQILRCAFPQLASFLRDPQLRMQ
jgi:hypothetical protein